MQKKTCARDEESLSLMAMVQVVGAPRGWSNVFFLVCFVFRALSVVEACLGHLTESPLRILN